MEAIAFADVKRNLARTMDRVCDDRQPVVITRAGKPAVVMLSLDEYTSLDETAYLLRSAENARRLLRSIEEFESGGGTEHELIE